MIIDDRLEVSDAQALTGTAASTDVVDTLSSRDIAPGKTIYAVVTVDVVLGGTSPTFAFSVQTDDNSGFSSATTLVTSQTFSGASQAPAGSVFWLAIPKTAERYLRLNYTLGGTSPTITVSGWFTDQEPREIRTYADAVN